MTYQEVQAKARQLRENGLLPKKFSLKQKQSILLEAINAVEDKETKTVFELTDEELKTYIGAVMSDLRSTWSDKKSYSYRVEVLEGLLEILIERQDLNLYRKDLSVVKGVREEIDEGEEPDGRVFRDKCHLYEYFSKKGATKPVKNFVDSNLVYPEYTSYYRFNY